MPAVVNILKSIIKNAQKGEMPLWHGTGVSPNELMQGAKAAEPRFSSEFFHSGTGGMVQGPGLYASEIAPVGKHYATITSSAESSFRGVPFKESNIIPIIGLDTKYGKDIALSFMRILNPYYNPYYTVSTDDFIHGKKFIEEKILNFAADKDLYSSKELSDLNKLSSFVKDVKYDDFAMDKKQYLYRVAFPKERYLDWYEKDSGAKDIIRAFNKNIGDQEFPLREAPMAGHSLQYAMDVNAKDAFYQRNKHDLAAALEHEKKFVFDNILKAYENAGFAGTKYRGDRRSGNYYNYVLQKPERARILDAFKFGLGGVSLTPFLSQPKTQSRKSN